MTVEDDGFEEGEIEDGRKCFFSFFCIALEVDKIAKSLRCVLNKEYRFHLYPLPFSTHFQSMTSREEITMIPLFIQCLLPESLSR